MIFENIQYARAHVGPLFALDALPLDLVTDWDTQYTLAATEANIQDMLEDNDS